MKILVINAGSSSLKFKLFKMLDESVICSGLMQEIGKEEASVSFKHDDQELKKLMSIKDYNEALCILFDLIFEEGLLVDINELYAVGHRVVHGGDVFSKATQINGEVVSRLKEFIPLAPLHNPANISGILAVKQRSDTIRQVAVFDTAFHQSIPEHAFRYALESSLFFEGKIRRYGFHGSSHKYVLAQACKLLKQDEKQTNIISLHLGNGASACAIQAGQSIDTSMGMTPLEGLVMGTRSGDIDSGIIFYLHEHKGYSLEKIETILEKESGLFGLCGENDMRTIIKKAKAGNKYQLAIDIFVYRIKKYIGSYFAILERVDALVFTGGIGENSSEIRSLIIEGLKGLGISYDVHKNREMIKNKFSFHKEKSEIKLFVIATDEELEIALQTKEALDE